MKKNNHPLSTRNILSFVGANLSLGALLGWVANLIQVLTFSNGLWIFLILLIFSSVVFGIQLYNYQLATINDLTQKLSDETKKRENLQERLDKLVVEFRSRSSVNPRPSVVNAFVCTKKFHKKPCEIHVTDITPKLLVVDKGEIDGLTYGMSFAIYKLGSTDCIDVCVVDRVEKTYSWLLHSGNQINSLISSEELVVQLLSPEIDDSERDIAEILLIAEGIIDL